MTLNPANLNSTRRVSLRPLAGEDYAALMELETDPTVLDTWRLRGGMPTDIVAYERGLWFGVSDQRIIERTSDGSMIGLAQLYNVDLRQGTGWLTIIAVPEVRGRGAVVEGLGLFLRRCFVTWGLRRVYFSVLAPNLDQFNSVVSRPGCSLYGTMRARTFLGTEPVDVVYGGIDAEPWLAHYQPLLQRLS
jgi:RimJ/RimL family protein N-acetyltransferase